MKLQRRFSLIGIFSLALGLITFIPHVEKAAAADPGVTCVGTSCTVTFESTGSVQTFTPAAVGQVLSITVAGGAGGKGGNDAGGPGGAGSNGATCTVNYRTTSRNSR